MSDREIILNFHGIGTPHVGVDAGERAYWIREAFFDAILDLAGRHPNNRDIVFSFDDGNRSDLTFAAPRLAERGRVGRFYLLTGRFDTAGYLTRADARALCAMGMEIGLHGRDHVDWRRVPASTLSEETIGARDNLASAIDRPVISVAIPFGAYNPRVIRHLRRCGFDRIYSSDGGTARAGALIATRTSIRSDMNIGDVGAILDDHQPLKRRVRRWLSTGLRRHLLGR